MQDPGVAGQWSAIIALPNVAIHTHVLPTGKVLFWGRRVNPTDSVDVQACEPMLWDPANQTSTPTATRPTLADGTAVNLFCSGHTFLPDGRLLVAGGHIVDSDGINQVAIYDPFQDTWSPTALMNEGRWYPTAITLADGSVLVSSGSLFTGNGQIVINDVQQIWKNGAWNSIVNFIGCRSIHACISLPTDGCSCAAEMLRASFLIRRTEALGPQALSGQPVTEIMHLL